MNQSVLQIVLISLATGIASAAIGFFVAAIPARRRLADLSARHQDRLDEVIADRDELAERSDAMRARIGALKSESANYRSELEGALSDAKSLAETVETLSGKQKNLDGTIRALRAEREATKSKINSMQSMLIAVHQRMSELQNEAEKAGAFYKRELVKSFNKRKQLEQEIAAARSEQEAFNKRIESAVDEHGSAEEMVVNAKLRLGQIDVLERNVNKLETEKAELTEDLKELRLQNEALERELAELVELRIHNQQLVQAVEELEKSRQKHEQDAEESAKLSNTLSLKLADLEKGLAAMEKEQNDAIKHVRESAASARPAANHASVEYPEKWDLIA